LAGRPTNRTPTTPDRQSVRSHQDFYTLQAKEATIAAKDDQVGVLKAQTEKTRQR
jgi:hypothetical protein